MDHLQALPVRGEAFLLRRGRHSILVDSGWDGRDLAAAISTHAPDLRKIDIAVCTHADGDHAGGFKTLLAHWQVPGAKGRQVAGELGQLWLPGRWVDVLPELMREAVAFGSALTVALDELASDNPDLARRDGEADDVVEDLDALVRMERGEATSPEQIRDDLRPEPDYDFDPFFADSDIDLGATEPLDEPEWFSDLRRRRDDILGAKQAAQKAFQLCRRRVRYRRSRGRIGTALTEFWLGLINAAENIGAIAEIAIERQLRVRWFDYDEFARTRSPRGGVPRFLVPLNAVEQAPHPRVDLSYLAKLSPVNAECLAFMAPPTWTHLGVVFCGDSPLGDGPRYANSFLGTLSPPKLPVVATAPHHGSESNRIAYCHLDRWANVLVWLRTGGTKKQPGPTFKAFGFPKRICSHCPQTGLKLRTAGIGGPGPGPWFGSFWVRGHCCACS